MRGYAAIGLVNPKCGQNVGSVLRAAGCYNASLVIISGSRPDKYLGKMPTDTQKAWKHIPTIRVNDVLEAVPYGCVPIAVDLIEGAKSLVAFTHPERAYYIFGPEDGTLGKSITEKCAHTIMVPTTHCMNLAAAVNVVLYDRMAKQPISSNTAAKP